MCGGKTEGQGQQVVQKDEPISREAVYHLSSEQKSKNRDKVKMAEEQGTPFSAGPLSRVAQVPDQPEHPWNQPETEEDTSGFL